MFWRWIHKLRSALDQPKSTNGKMFDHIKFYVIRMRIVQFSSFKSNLILQNLKNEQFHSDFSVSSFNGCCLFVACFSFVNLFLWTVCFLVLVFIIFFSAIFSLCVPAAHYNRSKYWMSFEWCNNWIEWMNHEKSVFK